MKADEDARCLALLLDLRDSAVVIREYISGVDKEQFMKDPILQDAVCLRLAVIGEITGKIDKPPKGLPLKAMKGLRNRITHDYGRVDVEIIWKVVQTDLEMVIELVSTEIDRLTRKATS
jgi:uncharacterized protein with HEPN domain